MEIKVYFASKTTSAFCSHTRREINARVNSEKIIEEETLDLTKQRKSFTGEAQLGKYCKYCAFIR